MSKAFTKEDDDGGFAMPASARAIPTLVTARGAACARERIAELLGKSSGGDLEIARLEALLAAPIANAPESDAAAFGSLVHMKSAAGKERTVVLASPAEVGLVPSAISIASPLAQAVLGARAGDEIEIEGPRGAEVWTVLSVAH